jgi:hypothetical protein
MTQFGIPYRGSKSDVARAERIGDSDETEKANRATVSV